MFLEHVINFSVVISGPICFEKCACGAVRYDQRLGGGGGANHLHLLCEKACAFVVKSKEDLLNINESLPSFLVLIPQSHQD